MRAREQCPSTTVHPQPKSKAHITPSCTTGSFSHCSYYSPGSASPKSRRLHTAETLQKPCSLQVLVSHGMADISSHIRESSVATSILLGATPHPAFHGTTSFTSIPPIKLWRRVVFLKLCLRNQNAQGARSRHEPGTRSPLQPHMVKPPLQMQQFGCRGGSKLESPDMCPAPLCPCHSAACFCWWEPTGSTRTRAVLPPAGLPTPCLLFGGFEGPHLPGPGRCHLLGEHMGAGKLQEGDVGGPG